MQYKSKRFIIIDFLSQVFRFHLQNRTLQEAQCPHRPSFFQVKYHLVFLIIFFPTSFLPFSLIRGIRHLVLLDCLSRRRFRFFLIGGEECIDLQRIVWISFAFIRLYKGCWANNLKVIIIFSIFIIDKYLCGFLLNNLFRLFWL